MSSAPSSAGKLRCRQHRLRGGVRFGQGAGEIGIDPVARFDRHHMAANGAAKKRQVADDIENFVPDEFVRKPQRLLAQDRFAPNDNGILQASAFDQVFLHQRLDVLVVNEGPGRRDFPFVDLRRDSRGHELSEAIFRSGLGAGDAKLFVRQKDKERAVFCLDRERLADVEEMARRFLCDETPFTDRLDVAERAAVANWRLVRVHLDDGVVDLERAKSGENVLDRVHAHRAFSNRGRALDRFHVGDRGVDRRFVLQIFALELDPVIGRGGLDLKRDPSAGMERSAAQRSGFGEGMLKLGGGRHGSLPNRISRPSPVGLLLWTSPCGRRESAGGIWCVKRNRGGRRPLHSRGRQSCSSPDDRT